MIKASKFNILLLMFTLFLCLQVQAQTIITRVAKLEIDGKEVKKNYTVLLYSEDKRIEAKRTSDGFIVPDELRSKENLGVIITLGKHKLDFSEIHISNFETVWTIGIDKKPLSDEIIYLVEGKAVKAAHYIKFVSDIGLDRMFTVFVK